MLNPWNIACHRAKVSVHILIVVIIIHHCLSRCNLGVTLIYCAKHYVRSM